jgi:phage head maturation protease
MSKSKGTIHRSSLKVGRQGLRIEGRVAPFGIPNTYGEVFTEETFKEYVAGTPGVVMFCQHDYKHMVGFWDRLWIAPSGLFASGLITSPDAIRYACMLGADLHASVGCEATHNTVRRWVSNRLGGRLEFLDVIKRWDTKLVKSSWLAEISLTENRAYQRTYLKIGDLEEISPERSKTIAEQVRQMAKHAHPNAVITKREL